MVVEMITKEDLQQFRQQLLSDIKEIIAVTNANNDCVWLRSSEARQILKVSAGTLQNLRISGQLKPNKIGGTYYYNRGEIMDLPDGGDISKQKSYESIGFYVKQQNTEQEDQSQSYEVLAFEQGLVTSPCSGFVLPAEGRLMKRALI